MMVTSQEEVEAKQAQDDAEFNAKMTVYNGLTAVVKKNKAKPRRRTSRCQESACYCVKSHCNLQADGGSCPACKAAGGPMTIMGPNGLECACEICKCTCQISFPLSGRRTVALQYEMEQRSVKTEPTNTASFFHNMISSQVQNSTLTALQESGPHASVMQNAASLAANDIHNNTTLQSNVGLRNVMQAVIPKTTETSGGHSIQQLRVNHRAGRSLSQPTNHTLNPNGKFGIQVTPPLSRSSLASTGMGHDARFYRNGLSAQPIVPPIVPPPVAAAAAANQSSSISELDDDSEIQIVESLDYGKPKAKNPESPTRMRSLPKAKEETPRIIKRARKELNLALRSENKKKENKDSEKIAKIKTAREELSSERLTKNNIQYFVDNESGYEGSEDILEDTICFFN